MTRPLRSARWFEAATRMGHTHRQRILQAGFARGDWKGKPVIAIVTPGASSIPATPTSRARRGREARRLAGRRLPGRVPVMSLGEPFMKPTTMLYRNLLAIETEEVLRAHPVDGAVLLGGCDKTTPGLLMGASRWTCPRSAAGRADAEGRWRGQALGSGTDTGGLNDWKAGVLSDAEFTEMEDGVARSAGTLHDDGHGLDDDLAGRGARHDVAGCVLDPGAGQPAPAHGGGTGRRAVAMVAEDLRPIDILTAAGFANAIVTLMALGGSTNAVIHSSPWRVAPAFHSRSTISTRSARVPVLADMRPSGAS